MTSKTAWEIGRQQQADERAEREENLRRFKAAGFNPYDLVSFVNALAGGRYIPDDHRGSEAFSWYAREIVRGRPGPMALGRYLASFTPTR